MIDFVNQITTKQLHTLNLGAFRAPGAVDHYALSVVKPKTWKHLNSM